VKRLHLGQSRSEGIDWPTFVARQKVTPTSAINTDARECGYTHVYVSGPNGVVLGEWEIPS
jgi:hypothetical protein